MSQYTSFIAEQRPTSRSALSALLTDSSSAIAVVRAATRMDRLIFMA